MNWLYLALMSVTVTLHVSEPSPSLKHPHGYGLNTCTGVFIGPNEILTAAHCTKESRGHQWIKTNEGKSYEVMIEHEDVHRDLCLLKVKKSIDHKYTYLGNPIQITENIYTVNSGDDLESTFNSGIVTNIFYNDDSGTLNTMHNAIILPGASGSGLFNSKGELVGINVSTLRTLSIAVDLLEIKAFLNDRS